MNNTVNGGVLREDLIDGLLVGDVDSIEFRATAAKDLDAIQDYLGGVVKAVNDDHIVAVLEQGERGERANVARATTEQGEGESEAWRTMEHAGGGCERGRTQ